MLHLASLLLAASAFGGEVNDIEYAKAGGVSLTLDAYVPEGKGPFTTIVIVHGGGWTNGNKRTYVTPWFKPLSEAGFAWFTINYRMAPDNKFPAPVDDVLTAVRWVKAHAKEYKVDTKRIVLMGESAGGHLVAMAAVKAKKQEQVSAVVDFYGPHDLLKRAVERNDPGPNLERFLGIKGLDDEAKRRLKEASPVNYVHKGLPPFLFIHGTKDPTVPFDQSPLLCDALKKLGNRCEVFPVEGATHGVGGWEKVPDQQAYKKKMVDWVKTTLH